MNRRHFLKNIGQIALVTALPKIAIAQYLSPTTIDPSSGLETFMELAENYPLKGKNVTILYPGSGWDLTPLEFALQLLHNSPVEKVNFIYTEIGEYEKDLPTWHEGISDLHQKVYQGLEKLVEANVIKEVAIDLSSKNPWKQDKIANSIIINYNILVAMKKEIRITLAYNCFEDRKEPTKEEKKEISPILIQNARKSYWLESHKGIAPTYFHQDHLNVADIVLSKQCGDFGLLQFDIVRALRQTQTRKPRVILTEHIDTMKSFTESLQQYDVSVNPLKNNKFGYCVSSDCPVGFVVVTPKQNRTKNLY